MEIHEHKCFHIILVFHETIATSSETWCIFAQVRLTIKCVSSGKRVENYTLTMIRLHMILFKTCISAFQLGQRREREDESLGL